MKTKNAINSAIKILLTQKKKKKSFPFRLDGKEQSSKHYKFKFYHIYNKFFRLKKKKKL